jgi:hypothetical protein
MHLMWSISTIIGRKKLQIIIVIVSFVFYTKCEFDSDLPGAGFWMIISSG